MVKTLMSLAAVGAGLSVALQQVLNARLRLDLGSPWWAGAASYALGLFVMVVGVVVTGAPAPSSAVLARVPWSSWAGGLFGAVFIGTAILVVPRLGAASALALIVVGQMAGSLILDRLGVLGLAPQPFTALRFAGASLLVLGVILIRA